jgi:hypothetical protein
VLLTPGTALGKRDRRVPAEETAWILLMRTELLAAELPLDLGPKLSGWHAGVVEHTGTVAALV